MEIQVQPVKQLPLIEPYYQAFDDIGNPMGVDDLLNRCQTGDRHAENELISHYFGRLADQAQRKIGDQFQGKFDGEDIAISVLKSVALRMRSGKVEIEDEKRFWALLMAVMKNKVHRQIEYWTALGRDVHREKNGDREGEEDSLPLVVLEGMSREPTPEEAVATSELIEGLLAKLDELTLDRYSEPSCKEVLLARLEGKEYAEICDDAERKYGRKLSTKSIYHRMKATEEALGCFIQGDS
ncbi:MAG: RNA polymerase sigma factor [Pirellula sp.]